MSHEVFDTLAAGYALRTLDGPDRTEFDAHLAQGCARCEALLRESYEALAMLGRGAPSEIPPASIKQALLARIGAETARATPAAPAGAERAVRPTPRPRRPAWIPWALGTAAAAVAAAFFTGMFVAGRYEAELGRMAREASALRERVREEQARPPRAPSPERLTALLLDPATRVLVLEGTGPAPAAVGRVIYHEREGGHLLAANLPPPGPGKTYELWIITGGKPRAAGVFDVDAAGRAARPVEPIVTGRADVFAVTLEPAGGVPAPTGPIVLASK
jgi:anti-sigma-K factor RskA